MVPHPSLPVAGEASGVGLGEGEGRGAASSGSESSHSVEPFVAFGAPKPRQPLLDHFYTGGVSSSWLGKPHSSVKDVLKTLRRDAWARAAWSAPGADPAAQLGAKLSLAPTPARPGPGKWAQKDAQSSAL